jgi:hypothetical protein
MNRFLVCLAIGLLSPVVADAGFSFHIAANETPFAGTAGEIEFQFNSVPGSTFACWATPRAPRPRALSSAIPRASMLTLIPGFCSAARPRTQSRSMRTSTIPISRAALPSSTTTTSAIRSSRSIPPSSSPLHGSIWAAPGARSCNRVRAYPWSPRPCPPPQSRLPWHCWPALHAANSKSQTHKRLGSRDHRSPDAQASGFPLLGLHRVASMSQQTLPSRLTARPALVRWGRR